ncbi:MBL fold metallo-hydrolase [Rhodovulum sp. DZ06]|uniref:MBL fold metallo-hydrolase n=1 Tax=Rhodovulum sp. DZ06 TaxID=3425126 RepID=UPI003D33DC9D
MKAPLAALLATAAPVALAVAAPAMASEDIPDQYPQSALYSKPVELAAGVWSSIGATAPPTEANAGHNNNLSFIITGDGVVVVNAGANNALAAALHEEIKAITDQPVKLVINENGQGHAMLGNGYWVDQGVEVLAHVEAAEEFEDRGPGGLERMKRVNAAHALDTRVQGPTITFEDEYIVEMGDMRIEVLHLGPAHSPGDISVWIPEKKVVIAGDIAFHERMPPIFSDTCTSCWLETWEEALEPLGAEHVVPGHGHPTTMEVVRHGTVDYIADLRAKVGAHLEAGGTLADAYYVDQSAWEHLDTFEELATKNAGVVFAEMEFE